EFVVDEARADPTSRLLAEYGDRIRLVTHPARTGVVAMGNAGAAAASGEYLAFLNTDTVPQTGWLEALVRYAEASPAAAVVGSKLLYPNDVVHHAGVVIGHDRSPHPLYAGFPADHPAVSRSRRLQVAAGPGL